jgi:hypothetical protein
MPYSGPNDPQLPDNVQALPEAARAQWVEVWNRSYEDCIDEGGEVSECEGVAFRNANGVANEREGEPMADQKEAIAEMVGGDWIDLPSNVYSFDDMDDLQAAEDERAYLNRMTSAFQQIVRNIMYSAPLEADRVELLRVATEQFIERLQLPICSEMGEVLAEASSEPLEILEEVKDPSKQNPLVIKMQLLEPGFGNADDNHYYPRDMVERDAGVFVGAKMYETDHRPEEKSTRTMAGQVKEIIGFTESGAPLARVHIWSPGLAHKLRNMAELGDIDQMATSILARGEAESGEVEGKEARIVKRISRALSVDFVTQAGAGGRVLEIMGESDMTEGKKEPQEETVEELLMENDESGEEEAPVNQANSADAEEDPENTEDEDEPQADELDEPAETDPMDGNGEVLSEADMRAVCEMAQVPAAICTRLLTRSFEDVASLREAIETEYRYIREAAGSKAVFGEVLGNENTQQPVRSQEERMAELESEYDKIDRKYGL